MGELADRFEKLCDVLTDGDSEPQGHERALLWGAINQLEQRLASLQSTPKFGLADRIYAARGRLDNLDVPPVSEPLVLAEVRAIEADARAHAAEQRADALLAAVSVAIQRKMQVIEIVNVKPDISGVITLRVPGSYSQIGNDGQLRAALLLAASPPNPDLLERASVELAEEYIRVKAEQAQTAPAAANPSTP
jgi:hypothetical protein